MPPHVAIIGAGLSGLALAVALHQQQIPCTIYEARSSAPVNIGGAVMLSPNALRVLDALQLYTAISASGYAFSSLEFRDATQSPPTLKEIQEFGGQAKYGYPALRIYRTELVDALLSAVSAAGVTISYGRKFTRVVDETAHGVTIEFADGARETAGLLIGADGIHSTVRQYLHPHVATRFVGIAGISAVTPTEKLAPPHDMHFPVAFMHPAVGAYVLAPQRPDGSEIFWGRQKRVDGEPTRAEWDAMAADKDALVEFLAAGVEKLPDVVRRATEHLDRDSIRVWPFHVVPKLDSWSSEKQHRRVVILGDAAHAIPPSSGQGINQAFEDVYIFARLLAAAEEAEGKKEGSKADVMKDALVFWQNYRQARVDKVLELNKQIDLRRLPPSQRGQGAEEPVEKLALDLGWLYNADFEAVVQDWVAGRTAESSAQRT